MSIASKKLQLLFDCPSCAAQKMTFDILESSFDPSGDLNTVLFCRCRSCSYSTALTAMLIRTHALVNSQQNGIVVNSYLHNIALQPPKFGNGRPCPDFCPNEVAQAFDEAILCLGVSAFNGSGAMFRKTIDLATRFIVPANDENVIGDNSYISWKTFKDLRLRIDWLLEKGFLDRKLSPLIDCIREDGNDAAHSSENLDHETCLDLQDFTIAILETIFTEPGRISESIRRRNERRGR